MSRSSDPLCFVTPGEQDALAEGGYIHEPDPLRARFQREVPLRWNKWVRQIHRWLSIAFTITVIANFVVLAQRGGGMPPPWITYSPLLPLAVLLLTGLYMFALPYVAKWRSGRRTD